MEDKILSAIVMLVKDDQLIQEMVAIELREAGFETIMLSNPEAAMESLEAKDHDLRGLITDINLGGDLDGWALARTARATYPRLPVVYMSGGQSDEWTSQGVPDSIMVAKPFVPVQIITALATLMNSVQPPNRT